MTEVDASNGSGTKKSIAGSLRSVIRLAAFCLLTGLVFIIFWPTFMSAHHKANDSACHNNMRELSQAVLQYSADWDDSMPPSGHWADAAILHIRPAKRLQTFHCPDARSPYSYVFNVHLDRLRVERLADAAQTPMIYEGDVSRIESSGDGFTIPIAIRHNISRSYVAFADGHTRWTTLALARELNWANERAVQSKKTDAVKGRAGGE